MQFSYRIISKSPLTHNTFSITLTPTTHPLPPIPTSSFFYIFNDSLSNKKPYTPVSHTDSTITFAIKIYPTGILSNYINNKSINDTLSLSSPVNKQLYVKNKHRDILLIAGGTGITPMLQILSENDDTNFILIFCNLTPEDIFLEDMLGLYSRLKVVHCIESVDGRITKEIVEREIKIDGELLIDYCYVCGPKMFMESVCGGKESNEVDGILKEIGLKKEMVYKF